MTLEEKVIALVADSLHQDASAIKTDSSFVDDLGADSLDQPELMMSIEDAFKSFMNGESIPEEEAQKFETVGSVIEFLKSKGVPENL